MRNNTSSKNVSPKIVAIILIAIFIVVAIIDRVFISSTTFSRLLGLQLDIILFGANFKIPRIGAILPLLALFLSLFGILLYNFKPHTRQEWGQVWREWRRGAIFIIAIPLFMLFGGFLYKLLGDNWPQKIKTIVESFGVSPTIYILDDELVTLNGSLASFLGLLVGILLLFTFGIRHRDINI